MYKYLILLILFTGSKISAQTHLPVQLVYFKYELVDSSLVLLWGTATEENCYGFNVERYSGSGWDIIGFQQGHGNSNIPWDYSLIDTTAKMDTVYLYRLKQIDNDGGSEYSDTLTVSTVTKVKKIKGNKPLFFSVSQNYPNPFNPSTSIQINMEKAGNLILKIYDTLGRLIDTKNYGYKLPGTYLVNYNASRLSSGIYFYDVKAGKYSQTRSMILLK